MNIKLMVCCQAKVHVNRAENAAINQRGSHTQAVWAHSSVSRTLVITRIPDVNSLT